MARGGAVLLLIALCVLPAIVTAGRPFKNPLKVRGSVYCDACRAGFETSKATGIAGAKVKAECRAKKSMELVFSKEATTDSKGSYTFDVDEDHEDQICDVLLVSSPLEGCSKPSLGRDRARVILTRQNGIASDDRYANAMGFMKDQPEAECTEILKQYQEFENED
ncbi:hypothetical protein K2173_011169 [Erythroxylum novogranatense]|uniref:Uncharacterized protein n=1 Tax=Erythroxylum novogranatense TaxID=1862640 RepID=A0AAV8T9C5_9ROSI|nr:hypothetical protein K2173_011169 [Erythroxylum novogranatense]